MFGDDEGATQVQTFQKYFSYLFYCFVFYFIFLFCHFRFPEIASNCIRTDCCSLGPSFTSWHASPI